MIRIAELTPLVERVQELLAARERVLLGVTGAPGAGKSTLGAALVGEFDASVVIPMDGFHLAASVIAGTPAEARRGAMDTFDVDGFIVLLQRIRGQADRTVYAPEFRRDASGADPVAGAIAVPPDTRLVVVEGNYLLADAPGWRDAAGLLDEVWFVEVDDDLRRSRLIRRHTACGMSPAEAESFALGSDEANSREVASVRDRATRIVRLSDDRGESRLRPR